MARSPKFQKTVFDNGLTLISERHPEFRSLSIGIWVKVGTRHESVKEAGVSHFLEHMLFKGTKKKSALDIASIVDQAGGDFNAFTAREYTCFHILLLSRDLNLGLEILSDVVLNSSFDAVELQRERKVILQEIAMVEESPEEMAHDFFYELSYGSHGLGRPILGTEKSISRMKRSDLVNFFRTHYRPDQLILSVAGDIDHAQVKRKVRDLAKKKWPGRKNGEFKAVETMKPQLQSGTWWIDRPAEQAHLLWGVEGPTYASKDRFPAFLLNVYLGGGMSSLLFQEIREKHGLSYTVYSNLSPYSDTGMFNVYAGTKVEQVPLCLKLIEESAEKLTQKMMSKSELKMIQDNLKGTIQLSADNVESRMMSIAKNEIFFGRNISVDEVCKQIDGVTSEEIRRVGRKILAGSRSILVLGPKPSRKVISQVKPEILRR